MTPTLALEALMMHPGYNRFIERARQAAPTALVDQLDAAATDAHRLSQLVASQGGDYAVGGGPAGDFPVWLRLGLLDVAAQWADGRAATCRHSPSPDHPEPVLAAAWKPGVVSCVLCAHLWATSRAANRTCDCCGRLCAGPEHGDGIYPGMVQLGPLVYQYGTCGGCRPTISENPLSATLPAERGGARGRGRVQPRGSRGRKRGRGSR